MTKHPKQTLENTSKILAGAEKPQRTRSSYFPDWVLRQGCGSLGRLQRVVRRNERDHESVETENQI